MGWNLALARLSKQFLFDAGLFGILMLFALFLIVRNKQKKAFLASVSVFALFVFFCSPLGIHVLAAPLLRFADAREHSAENKHCLASFTNIVVLGAGLAARNLPGETSSLRLIRASEFIAANPRPFFVVLAGGTTDESIGQSEARGMKFAFEQILTSAERVEIELEEHSLNTYENAVLVRKKLESQQKALEVIVVTSELHLARATATFKRQGMTVCALSSQSLQLKPFGILAFANGANTVSILNEHLGFLGYWLKGWLS